MRVYELAKELSITNRELIEMLKDLGVEVKSHFSKIADEEQKLVKELLEEKKKEEVKEVKVELEEKPKEERKVEIREEIKLPKLIKLPNTISIRELASKFNISIPSLIKSLMDIGVIVNINQSVNYDIVKRIAHLYNYEVELIEEEISAKKDKELEEENLVPRNPIVTVMGHVDHGKTKLLDAIRKTNVAEKEPGGITQHIGASVINYNNKRIVFLDTPGHEAFTQMRARGAKITDIVVLVVAADDGVMPQTIEAINHARAANVPIIVAINKIDKENANIERVMRQLADYDLLPEKWGGNTICVPISAKYNQNLDELLEMVHLQAEILELKASSTANPKGYVIEAKLDKERGPVATVILQHGTLKIGNAIVAGTSCGKIRAMIDDKGKRVKEVFPAEPVEIIGLDTPPQAGDLIIKVDNEVVAREIVSRRKEEQEKKTRLISLENLYTQMQEGKLKELNIIIKADVYGSIEALKRSIERLSEENIKPQVIHAQVGSITETDVLLAKASNAIIIGFNSKPTEKAKRMAEQEGVDIRYYNVIYYVIEDIKAAIVGMLEPKYEEEIIGKAEVRAVYKASKFGKVAGCYVKEGIIKKDTYVRVMKDDIVIHSGKIDSLKRFKEDVKEVKQGFECGIGIHDFDAYEIGDILEVYELKEVKRKINS